MVLTDILNDIYHSAQNVIRPAVLGLTLAYCGPTVDDDRGCDTDADCHSDRICNYNTGRCESPGGGNGSNNGRRDYEFDEEFYCNEFVAMCNTKTRQYDLEDCLDLCGRRGIRNYECVMTLCEVELGVCPNNLGMHAREAYKCMESYGWQCEKTQEWDSVDCIPPQ